MSYSNVAAATTAAHQRLSQLLMVRSARRRAVRSALTTDVHPAPLASRRRFYALQAKLVIEKSAFAALCVEIANKYDGAEEDEVEGAGSAAAATRVIKQLNRMFAFVGMRVVARPCEADGKEYVVLTSFVADNLSKLATTKKQKHLAMLNRIVRVLGKRAASGIGAIDEMEALNMRGDLSQTQAHEVLQRAAREHVVVRWQPPRDAHDAARRGRMLVLGVRALADFETVLVESCGARKCVMSYVPVMFGPRCSNPACAARITQQQHESLWNAGAQGRARKRKLSAPSAASSAAASPPPDAYGPGAVVKCTKCARGTFEAATFRTDEDDSEEAEGSSSAAAAETANGDGGDGGGEVDGGERVAPPPRTRRRQEASAAGFDG